MDAVDGIDLSSAGAPSLILRDLSEYSTLPFLAAFDVPELPSAANTPSQKSKTQKRVTYIALSKKSMPQLVELFLRFKEDADIYLDGTIESIFAVRMASLPSTLYIHFRSCRLTPFLSN